MFEPDFFRVNKNCFHLQDVPKILRAVGLTKIRPPKCYGKKIKIETPPDYLSVTFQLHELCHNEDFGRLV